MDTGDRKLRDALENLALFLSDEVAPLLAVDSVETLLDAPVDAVVDQLRSWVTLQQGYHRGSVSSADLYFHALKKLQLLAELNLLDSAALDEFLTDLRGVIVSEVSEEARGELERKLRRLGLGQDSGRAVGILHRADREGEDPERTPEREDEREEGPSPPRSFEAPPSAGGTHRPEARSRKQDGVAGAARIPAPEEDSAAIVLRAMDRAILRFNTGRLGPALDAVEDLREIVEREEVPRSTVDLVAKSAQSKIDREQLRRRANDPERFPALRQFLDVFPRYRPDSLLKELDVEEDRGRRRLLLALLIVHGPAARPILIETLRSLLEEGRRHDRWYLERNLVHLLRCIPPESESRSEEEVELVSELVDLEEAHQLVREAVAHLGVAGGETAESALVNTLREIEHALDDPDRTAHGRGILHKLLEQVAASLASHGGAKALRVLADYALHGQTHVAMSRLVELRAVDLRRHPGTLRLILSRLDEILGTRLPGFMTGKRATEVRALVEAIAGTPAAAVRERLHEVRRRYQGRELAEVATQILAAMPETGSSTDVSGETAPGAATTPRRKLDGSAFEGDIDTFGLPNILQSVAQSQLSGILLLRDDEDRVHARFDFEEGTLTDCRTRDLEGEEAFYQIFHTASEGTFQFVRRSAPGSPRRIARPLPGLIMEAMRRSEAHEAAREAVPDEATLVPTGQKPTPRPGEDRGDLVRWLWVEIMDGATPLECERESDVDPFWIRALLAHWVEEGALRLET